MILTLFYFFQVESNLSNNSEQSKQTKQTENPKLCNKALMLITDGAPESYEKVFQEYNWPSNKSVIFVSVNCSIIAKKFKRICHM